MKRLAVLILMLGAASPLLVLQQGCVGDFAPLKVMVLTTTPTLTVTLTPTIAPPTNTPTLTPTLTPILGSSPDFIDDMEDNNNGIMTNQGRGGYWYAYNDGTGGGVQQTGGVVSPFTMGAPGLGYDGTGTSLYCVRITTNAGFTNYGSGFGFSLVNPQANYNASSHTGIQLYARNAIGNLSIKMLINDEAVNTAIPAYSIGGHRMMMNLTSSWSVFRLPLAGPGSFTTSPNDYGGPTVFDPTKIQQIQWAIPPSIATDVQIDNIAFY